MVLQATDSNFNELKSEGVGIIDFYSTHCGPCKVLLPVLLKIESEMPFINLIKVNTDECPKVAEEFRISAVPTVYLFKDGKMTEYQRSYAEEDIKQALAAVIYG